MKRGAIYARSATNNEKAVASQIEQCRAFAKEHEIEVKDHHVYSEWARSGLAHPLSSAQLVALFSAAYARKLDVLIIKDLERLSRSHTDLLTMLGILKGQGVTVMSLEWNEGIHPFFMEGEEG